MPSARGVRVRAQGWVRRICAQGYMGCAGGVRAGVYRVCGQKGGGSRPWAQAAGFAGFFPDSQSFPTGSAMEQICQSNLQTPALLDF